MKEKIKALIAKHLLKQSNLKLTLRNLILIDALTEDLENQILD